MALAWNPHTAILPASFIKTCPERQPTYEALLEVHFTDLFLFSLALRTLIQDGLWTPYSFASRRRKRAHFGLESLPLF